MCVFAKYLGNSSGSWDKSFENNHSSFNASASTLVPRLDSSILSSKIKFKRQGIDIPDGCLFKSAMKLVDPLSNVRRNKWITIAEGVKGKGKNIVQDSIDLTVDEDDDEEEEEEDLIQQYSEPYPGQQSNYPSQSFYNHKMFSNWAPEDDDADPVNLKSRKFPSVIDSMRRQDSTLGQEDQENQSGCEAFAYQD
ncbi:hypothetical protein BY996DRAFT_6412835 [Phakopsora pachyrhizi]|uniref:Uncharacterized protein n=1 Tax=Phakopsora pachyrhizi TaxID=170000 RepID=A0AAV0BT85_PHAPC|nr:hypothetical protein BY996DRAFT_6412835 [Phakopsora pachyrhizi]CAH7689500.1 hypothetical protein PPACK8108_LOCUS24587 [Phakopsora pachyrhizi]